ncbi:MAG: hypothetical protein ACJ71K_21735 [Nitrososphaeraceae archaeon]
MRGNEFRQSHDAEDDLNLFKSLKLGLLDWCLERILLKRLISPRGPSGFDKNLIEFIIKIL